MLIIVYMNIRIYNTFVIFYSFMKLENNVEILGRIDLCGLKFVQSRAD